MMGKNEIRKGHNFRQRKNRSILDAFDPKTKIQRSVKVGSVLVLDHTLICNVRCQKSSGKQHSLDTTQCNTTLATVGNFLPLMLHHVV